MLEKTGLYTGHLKKGVILLLRRKVFDELYDWMKKRKKLKRKKCLIVQGARQVGKTFAIERFAGETYDEVVSINFKESTDGDISMIFPIMPMLKKK